MILGEDIGRITAEIIAIGAAITGGWLVYRAVAKVQMDSERFRNELAEHTAELHEQQIEELRTQNEALRRKLKGENGWSK